MSRIVFGPHLNFSLNDKKERAWRVQTAERFLLLSGYAIARLGAQLVLVTQVGSIQSIFCLDNCKFYLCAAASAASKHLNLIFFAKHPHTNYLRCDKSEKHADDQMRQQRVLNKKKTLKQSATAKTRNEKFVYLSQMSAMADSIERQYTIIN